MGTCTALISRMTSVRPAVLICLYAVAAVSCRVSGATRDDKHEGVGVPARFGFGRTATTSEIAAWDIDVRPDGRGLPHDSGTVRQGAAIYAARCAVCHGADGVHG